MLEVGVLGRMLPVVRHVDKIIEAATIGIAFQDRRELFLMQLD